MDRQVYDGIAGLYAAHRASYPWELIAAFRDACPIGEKSGLVLDVGSGTGIATRQLRAVFPAHVAVIGIEPGADMRATAVASSKECSNLAFLDAPAEKLPLAKGTAAGILVAQALHWFDRPRFYAEAARVLRPGGILGIMHNDRDWRESAFLAAYEVLLETYGDNYTRDYRRFDMEQETASAAGLEFRCRINSQFVLEMPRAEFAAWAFTSSKMQNVVRNIGQQRVRVLLAELVDSYFSDETAVTIPYQSELYLVRNVIL